MHDPEQPPERSVEGDKQEEFIRRGIIYPPPPSFYQNMPADATEPRASLPMPYIADPGYSGSAIGAQNRPPTAPPFMPAPPPQTPARRPRTWIWVVATILGVAFLASCGLCAWSAYSLFAPTFQQLSGAVDIVNNYYKELQAQNYSAAYTYLEPQGPLHGLTLSDFTQEARGRDEQYGPVLSYTPSQPSFNTTNSSSGPDLSHFTIVIAIERSKLKYNAQLTLSRSNNRWKIVDYNRI